MLALAGYTVHAAVKIPFPVLAGALSFIGGSLVKKFSQNAGTTKAFILFVHFAGLSACLLAGGLLMTRADISSFTSSRSEVVLWVSGILTAFWILTLWFKGASFAKSADTVERIGTEFDKGVAAFLLVFLSSAFVNVKFGLSISWPASFPLFMVFFLLSLATMEISSPEGETDRDVGGTRGFGASVLFGFLILGVGAGVVYLLMPLLVSGAQFAYEALGSAASPMGPVIVRALRFLLSRKARSLREDMPSGITDHSAIKGGPAKEPSSFEWALGWGLTGLLTAVIVFVSGLVLYYAIKALMSRTAVPDSSRGKGSGYLNFLMRLVHAIRGFPLKTALHVFFHPCPVRLYERLNRWGRRTGMPRKPSETPLEYGQRLGRAFAALSSEIRLLTELYNREAYGTHSAGPEERLMGLKAWRHIRSLRFWPMRAQRLLKGASAMPATDRPVQ